MEACKHKGICFACASDTTAEWNKSVYIVKNGEVCSRYAEKKMQTNPTNDIRINKTLNADASGIFCYLLK
jgi:glutathione peroxidase-family protein